jgi:hypothetical protein
MAVLARDKAVFYNTPNVDVGSGTALTAGTLGSNTNGVTCFTAGAYGAIVESLVISTDDTAAVNVYFYIYRGTTVIPLGIVNVPVQSGDLATVSNIDALAGSGITLIGSIVNAQGKRIILLEASDELKFAVKANMTAGKNIFVTASGFDATTT